jgi:hypothetical protein
MSLAGGAPRDITAPDTYDWVAGFIPDGSAVYPWTLEKGQPVLARIALPGGARAVWADTDSTRPTTGICRSRLRVACERNPKYVVAIL